MAVLLTVLWVQRIVAALNGDLIGGGVTSETTMTVQALDLGLVVPASVIIAVLTWRRSPAGYAMAAAYVVTFAAMTAAIVAMLLSAWAVNGELALPPVVVFSLAGVVAVVLGVRMYRFGITNLAAWPRAGEPVEASAHLEGTEMGSTTSTWAGLGIALGSGVGAGLGIVTALLAGFGVAYGIVAGAAIGVVFGLLGGTVIDRRSVA